MSEKVKLFGRNKTEKLEVQPQHFLVEIKEPQHDKNFMITFTAATTGEAMAYNAAIRSIFEEQSIIVFHQAGTSSNSENPPGYHAWEMFMQVDRETLEKLLPDISQKAHELYTTVFASIDKT